MSSGKNLTESVNKEDIEFSGQIIGGGISS